MSRPSAKTAAALEAARAEAQAAVPVCTDASGARIRTVAVHLTPFAPGCAGVAIDNRKRWATLWGVSPVSALRKTLNRINRSPRAVALAVSPGGEDVDVLARPTVADLTADDPAVPVPFATFHAGLPLDEAQQALAALIAAGWEPARPIAAQD